MRVLLIGAAALTLMGCETVEVSQYSADTANITVAGNAYMTNQTVQTRAMQEAAKRTLAGGFQCFIVSGSQDEGRAGSFVVPGQAYTTTTGSAYGFGNMAYGTAQSNTTYTPAQTYNFYKPGIGMQIQMFHDAPPGGHCFQAAEVLAFTGARQH